MQRVLENWWFPIGAILFFFGCVYWQDAKDWVFAITLERPEWTPSGDPLATMDHHDALICWGKSEAYPPVDRFELRVDLTVTGGDYNHAYLWPSSRGECGILSLSALGLNPVSLRLYPSDTGEHHHYLVTTWSPTHKSEPDPAYDWSTTEITEGSDGYWMTFNFSSSNRPQPVIDIHVE